MRFRFTDLMMNAEKEEPPDGTVCQHPSCQRHSGCHPQSECRHSHCPAGTPQSTCNAPSQRCLPPPCVCSCTFTDAQGESSVEQESTQSLSLLRQQLRQALQPA